MKLRTSNTLLYTREWH